MVLIDTSSWIDALRRDGDPAIKARVALLLREGTAAWCDMVRLELWNGLRGAAEKKQMENLEADVHHLATSDAVWTKARLLARRARASGLTAPGSSPPHRSMRVGTRRVDGTRRRPPQIPCGTV